MSAPDNKGQAFAIGPSIKYDNGKGFFITAKFQKEMYVRNRAEGKAFWIKASIPFQPVSLTLAQSDVNEESAVVQPEQHSALPQNVRRVKQLAIFSSCQRWQLPAQLRHGNAMTVPRDARPINRALTPGNSHTLIYTIKNAFKQGIP